MTDPTERLEYFATNDESRGGDLLSEADLEDEVENCPLHYPIDDGSEDEADLALQDVFAYLRAVKRFGLALQQLGRTCDTEPKP